MIYRKLPKTASLPVTCHPASPAVGVKISAKDATSEINLTKHFVTREGSQRGARLRQADFSKKLLERGLTAPTQCAKPSKRGRLSAVKGSTCVERIIRRTAP